MAKWLLEHGAIIDADCLSAAMYNMEILKLLLEQGSNANAKDDKGNTALHSAAKFSKVKAAQLFLQYKADVNAKNKKGKTPLHKSMNVCIKIEMIRLLLANGAEVNARDSQNKTSLDLLEAHLAEGWTSEHKNKVKEIIRLLKAHGAQSDSCCLIL